MKVCQIRDDVTARAMLLEGGWSLEIRWGNPSSSEYWLVKEGREPLRVLQSATDCLGIAGPEWTAQRDDARRVTTWTHKAVLKPLPSAVPALPTTKGRR